MFLANPAGPGLNVEKALIACYNAKTGEEVYGKRRVGARGFTSSPWAYDGKLFCLSEDGDTLVIGAPAEQSSATGVDGDQASNAATDAGAAYVID